MRTKKSKSKQPAEQVVKDIRRRTRRHFSAENKNDIRMGVICAYLPPLFKPHENYTLALQNDVYEQASEELLDLLGFKVWHGNAALPDITRRRFRRDDTFSYGEVTPSE